MSNKKIVIFDTTLRDGQQCPGAGMTFEQNIEYAHLAAEVGIDVLEAGFPSASRADFKIVQTIAEELNGDSGPVVAGLCQLRDSQVDITIESLQPLVAAGRAKMHVYLPVDPELMIASLGKDAEDKEALIEKVAEYCKRAIDAGLQVEFSPEGYSRVGDNFDFTTDLIRAAVEAGADTINCPDTIGGASRFQGDQYFVNLMQRHADIIASEFPDSNVIWSTHCHNDFGLAVDNSITSVFEGPARQIEGCFNGVGERAGNAALEQCIMIIKEFSETVNPEEPFYTEVNTEKIQKISDFVQAHMLPRQPHWPVSGENAARHSSGGHTNAILKNPRAYQPFDPKEVGQEIGFIFGPLSGGNHAKSIIEGHGYKCDDSEKAEIAQFIKDLYHERRKGITDAELMRGYFQFRGPIKMEEIDYWRTKDTSELEFQGSFFGSDEGFRESHEGKDSALASLKIAIDREFPGVAIDHYRSDSVGSGIHARSLSVIQASHEDGGFAEGQAEDQDIGKSAMKALIDAVNQLYVDMNFSLKNE